MNKVSDDTTREVDRGRVPLRRFLTLSGALPGDRTRVSLGPGAVVLGRGADCDCPLDYGEVSRRHAELAHEGPVPVLRDLGSTNGSYLDGRRVGSAALREGSVVRLGTWLAVVEALAPDELSSRFAELAPGMMGNARLVRTLAPVRAAATSSLPVVLSGETGTGKERFAAAIHHMSRRSGVLHAINCAALPAGLAESELFGHERGAFTGAEHKTRGHFRAAEGGTLFLDELQELPLRMQAKVLRAIELKQITPLGDSRAVSFDARIVVACQRPLMELVAEGRFREDLAMRVSGLTVSIPPLRERRAEIPSLFEHFLREHASGVFPSPTAKFYERLCLYSWPGNVRELELMARRMLALHGQTTLTELELPEQFALSSENDLPTAQTRDEADRRLLNDALKRTGGNMKQAAGLANVSRARAYRLFGKRADAGGNASE